MGMTSKRNIKNVCARLDLWMSREKHQDSDESFVIFHQTAFPASSNLWLRGNCKSFSGARNIPYL